MSVDHYGVPFSAIEPGEIDQEQHDGVRDVFFVSHATMLVRADLFRELGGFDVATRARLRRHRPVLARRGSPARACSSRPRAACGTGGRPRSTSGERGASRPTEARAATQARVRVLIKSYSTVALLWVLPSGFVLTFGEARRARVHAALAPRASR